MKLKIIKSPNPNKKLRAIFTDENGKEVNIDFGDSSASDYTIHKNPIRAKAYLIRHRANEDWNKPMSAGALSRWILWNTPNLETNVRLFKRKFNLQ